MMSTTKKSLDVKLNGGSSKIMPESSVQTHTHVSQVVYARLKFHKVICVKPPFDSIKPGQMHERLDCGIEEALNPGGSRDGVSVLRRSFSQRSQRGLQFAFSHPIVCFGQEGAPIET